MKKALSILSKLSLAIGIFIMPFIFSWFTLKKGTEKKYKILAFGWLILYISLFTIGLMNPKTIETPQPKAEVSLNNCSYSLNVFSDINNLMDQIIKFRDEKASYKEIAEWRVAVFNPEFNNLSNKHHLAANIVMSPKHELARSVYTDYLLRMPLFLNDVYSAARTGDYSNIKMQSDIMKTVIPKIRKSCVKEETTVSKPIEENKVTSTQTKSINASQELHIVKKSNSGICHDNFSSFYNRTKNYTPYNTIQDCLNSGGRLPKK
ncbi:hypothetical protein EIJ81_06760 [Aliivibrio salmonicida]|uniref:Probable exclusion protein n=1 Tax=Aliivibrio salmonicida (strain LFI1238) TaxID=316275 RepID=B6EIQ0_ALISL|nr:hypothetical protein [Aliivibrio salmonicida]AZL84352.1 hypothetical protein EIJ81_06760 [Aliivibrio salmonicida]CAQ78694.1 probable exclusion protein [Aliivibrio salmonicida LFI1238]